MEHRRKRPIFEETRINNIIVGTQRTDMGWHNNQITKNGFSRLGPFTQTMTSDLRETIRKRRREKESKTDTEQGQADTTKVQPKDESRGRSDGRERERTTDGEMTDEDDRVEVMTRGQIRRNYKRRYPEVEDEVYQPLIKPNKQTRPSRHIEISLELMNEREKYQNPEIKESLLELAIKHREVYEMMRIQGK